MCVCVCLYLCVFVSVCVHVAMVESLRNCSFHSCLFYGPSHTGLFLLRLSNVGMVMAFVRILLISLPVHGTTLQPVIPAHISAPVFVPPASPKVDELLTIMSTVCDAVEAERPAMRLRRDRRQL